jgi:hypothetical protein
MAATGRFDVIPRRPRDSNEHVLPADRLTGARKNIQKI